MPPRRRNMSDPGGTPEGAPTAAARAADPPRGLMTPTTNGAPEQPRSSMLSRLIPKPEKFTGRGDVLLFLYSLTNYLTLVALADQTEMSDGLKIMLSAAFLSDYALTWYRANVSEYNLFSDFCDGMVAQFGDKNVETVARTKLERLKQNVGAVGSYITKFQEIGLSLSTGGADFFATHEAHHAFTRGLQPDIRTAVALAQKGNKDCREAMLLAAEYETARRMGAGPSHETPDGKFFNPKRYGLQPKINKMTRDISRDVCYNCGELGHHGRTCKNPPKAGANRHLNAKPAAR